MSMPESAISPSSATKPNGASARLSASEAPMTPSGALIITRPSRAKFCSWNITMVSINRPTTGNTAAIDALALVDSSIAPPISSR